MAWAGVLVLLAAAQDLTVAVPDFSYAGYHAGEADPPKLQPTLNVKDFGAVGDGRVDDTKAFRDALAEAARRGAAVRVPEGRWVITGVLQIDSSHIGIQGAGSGRTVLVCPRSMSDLFGAGRQWSWSGAILQVRPSKGAAVRIGKIERARAGDREVELRPGAGVEPPKAGEWLELCWHNDKGQDTLLDYLYGGVVPSGLMGDELKRADGPRVREWVQVQAIDGARVKLGQPLAIEIRPEWEVTVLRAPSIHEVGVEGLTFEFPETSYPGHLKEAGYNAIEMDAAIDCWVRDVETVNADSGLFAGRCKRVTVDGFRARGRTMHHVLCAGWSSDCLFTNWRIEAPHVHGTTISWSAHRNVFSNGWGRDLAMDAHRATPFENLHTNIVIECGASLPSPFRSGGSVPRGPHAARGNVYWNVEIRAAPGEGALRIPPQREWPLGVFVGWRGSRPVRFEEAAGLGQIIQFLNRAPAVENLHVYQRKRRVGR